MHRPELLIAPEMTPACEGSRCQECPGRRLTGRILHVCLCRHHLGTREGAVEPAAPPADPLRLASEPPGPVASRIKPSRIKPSHPCPRCAWPGKLDGQLQRQRGRPPDPMMAAYRQAQAELKRKARGPRAGDRAARKMERRKAAGLCIGCGKGPPVPGSVRCFDCIVKKRAYNQERSGATPWQPGGPGRPPLQPQDREGGDRSI